MICEAAEHPHDSARESGQLEDAFELFNKLSQKLADSYNELEQQVARLSTELADANSERIRELTEKERLAQRLESLLDSLPAGVIVVDEHDVIRQANPLAHDMLGTALHGQCWQQLARDSITANSDELRLQDGRWVSVTVRPLPGESGKLVLLADVSETRSLQDKLARQQRLGSLGEMVASLAHQLRTPLTAALLYLSNLQQANTGEAERQRFIDKARQRLLHLERMVNDMLMFARGDVVAAQTIRVARVLHKLRDSVQQQCDAAGIHLRCEIPATDACVQASEDTLLSVLQNLADNAIEACRSKQQQADYQGRLFIRSSIDAGQVHIDFMDNGCGMDEAMINRVLEPFYTTRQNGTGLGLAVVHAIAERYHGQLKILSSAGRGSCFTLILPQAHNDSLLNSNLVAGAQQAMPATARSSDIASKR